MESTLLLVAEPVAQAALLSALQQAKGSLEGVSIVSGSGALLDAPNKTTLLESLGGGSPYGRVMSVSSTAGFHTPARVAILATAAASGGAVVVQEPEQAAEGLRKAMMFSGLQGCEASAALSQGAAAMTAKKPNWEAGAKQALRKPPPAAENKVKVWTIAADEDEDEDLIDDAALLTEEDLKQPALPASDDCEIGKGGKKACKNCTCGRAEGAMPEDTDTSKVESACGSCYLGDAFRCGTCPYRGMPAFKPGEKITLQTDVMDL